MPYNNNTRTGEIYVADSWNRDLGLCGYTTTASTDACGYAATASAYTKGLADDVIAAQSRICATEASICSLECNTHSLTSSLDILSAKVDSLTEIVRKLQEVKEKSTISRIDRSQFRTLNRTHEVLN